MGSLDYQAADAFRLIDKLWAEHFAPPPDLTVEQWADGRLVLPREMSAEPGPIRLDRTPYLRQIFADLADISVEEIDLMFATQLGKSTAILAYFCYTVDYQPAPIMLVLPTLDVAKKFSKQRIAPLIEANPFLREKIREARSRDSDNTTLMKGFPGGILVITGANSPAGLASMPMMIVLFDEVDDYPEDAGGQGEPTKIATARQDTFARRKRVKSSSPKRPKGRSMIEADFERGTQFRYYVRCPHCDQSQTLRWPQLKWISDPSFDPSSVAYLCESCSVLIEEHYKTQMLESGEWRAGNPAARTRSYHLNSLYSPLGWLSWRAMVREWIDAKERAEAGDLMPLRTFINTRLAETWEEQAEKLVANELQQAAEPFELKTVQKEVLLLVAFVDVQDNRFEIDVWGFCEGCDDMFTVDHLVIPANPGLDEDWKKVDAALQTKYPHALGGRIGIEAAGIDTGGHYTHDVYRFVRSMPSARKIAATKGADRPNMPISSKASTVDVNWRGGIIKNGIKLWHVGVNAGKDLLFSRIRAGRVHMSHELPAEWFEQLAAEHRVKHRTARGERSVWVKKSQGIRNEALDCAVGAIWCIERLGAARWPRKYWEILRERAAPNLFSGNQPPAAIAEKEIVSSDSPSPAPPQISNAPVRRAGRRRGGFVGEWKNRR